MTAPTCTYPTPPDETSTAQHANQTGEVAPKPRTTGGSSRGAKRIGLLGTALIVGLALAVGAGGGYALADALTEVDPATVPQGELALENHVSTPFHLKVGHGPEHIFSNGADVTVEHDSFPTATSSGWHSHGGPIFVEVVSGTLTTYEKNDPTCTPRVFGAGTGFMEETGDIHDARNETAVATDIYVEYILPPGSGDAGLFQPAPDHSNPACPFAN